MPRRAQWCGAEKIRRQRIYPRTALTFLVLTSVLGCGGDDRHASQFGPGSVSTAIGSPTGTLTPRQPLPPTPTATVSPAGAPPETPMGLPTPRVSASAMPAATATPMPEPQPSPTEAIIGTRPQTPEITSPTPEGVQDIAAGDVHMEAGPFIDADGDGPRMSEWEIWDTARNVRVWRGTGEGLEFSHVHLVNGRLEAHLTGQSSLEFATWYQLRVRYRDGSGDPATEWSDWSAWRHFRTAPFGVQPLRTRDVLDDPAPQWNDEAGSPVAVPDGVTAMIRRAPVPDGDDGFRMLLAWSSDRLMASNFPPLEAPEAVQLTVANSGQTPVSLSLSRMRLTLADPDDGDAARDIVVAVPALDLAPNQSASFWVAQNGATFVAYSSEQEPVFSRPARETVAPWVIPPGYEATEVLDGLTFPTRVAFVPQTPADPDAPLYYVLELKGRIWVVNGLGEKSVYADGLIDFSSPAPASNPGQVGLGGFAVEPGSGDLLVTRTYHAPATPLSWSLMSDPPGWSLYMPGLANWAGGNAETRVVRYQELAPGVGTWSFSTRVEFPIDHGRERQTGDTAFGIVAYADSDNAVFVDFQGLAQMVETIYANSYQLQQKQMRATLGGWLRATYDHGLMTFAQRSSVDAAWSEFYRIDGLPFVPTRVGIYGRDFSGLVASANFSEIERDDTAIDPAGLADDTVPVSNQWLHNQVIRLHSTDGGRTMTALSGVLDMPNDLSHESHQIQDVVVAPDGTLLVSVGDGFYPQASQDLTRFTGKILRLNPDGSAPADNPLFDPAGPTAARSYIYVYGLRNTFGMALRHSDGRVFCSENGPSRDRVYSPEAGWNMGYDGTDQSMFTHALFTWSPAIAPVGIDVMQNGAFPPAFADWIFVAAAGQDFTTGVSKTGKRIYAFQVDKNGNLTDGPEEFLRYEGSGKATPIGLAFGPDGLYFTTLYNTDPTADSFSDARVVRVRYVGPASSTLSQ
jgi:Glucose / Sorbosone dehydrogenase